MRSAAAILLFLVSLTIPVRPQEIADEQKIRQLMDEIAKAFVERDSGPFERIYADSFVSVRDKPIYNSRAQLIAMMNFDAPILKAGKRLDYETLSYNADNPQIRFFGSTAIVNSRKNNHWQYRDNKCLTRYQATDVWVKRGDHWKLVASHATTFQCDPMPWLPGHQALKIVPAAATPQTLPVSTVDNEISTALNPGDEATANRLFAKGYIHTDLEGQVLPDRGQIIAALLPGKERENEVLQVFDNTAIYLLRQKVPARPGNRSYSQQFMIVMVKMEGRWQIAASHVTKSSE